MNFLDRFSKNNIKKIRPVEAELFHADRQTDTDRPTDRHRQTHLTVAFRNIANAPNNGTREGVF